MITRFMIFFHEAILQEFVCKHYFRMADKIMVKNLLMSGPTGLNVIVSAGVGSIINKDLPGNSICASMSCKQSNTYEGYMKKVVFRGEEQLKR